jgi:hypothetical protein
MNRRMNALTVVLVGLAACGPARSSPVPARGPQDVLIVETQDGLELGRSADGEVILDVPGGVTSPDREVLVSAESRGTDTLVRRLDLDGNELDRWSIPGDLAARVVSPSGTTVALTERTGTSTSTYAPAPRARTHIAVAGPHGAVDELDLRGNFEPEAFSTDDRQLFVLEYIPALAPTRYRVRRVVLSKGRVVPIGRLKTAAPDQMQGTGRTQVYSPFGDELYTLYTQQHSAGHETGAFTGDHAFVHLLNLEGWTHCIDLPHTFGHGRATASALAVSPDGTLFVVDWSAGVVASIVPADLEVRTTATVAFGEPDDDSFAVTDGDRLYVAGGSEVVVLDTQSLHEIARWSSPAEITGLALDDAGARLYASSADRVTSIDATSGETLGSASVAGVRGLVDAAPGP